MASEGKAAAAAAARTAADMWAALGMDAWVVVPIESTTRPGHQLEGTRLTVVNMSKGLGAAEAADAASGEDGSGCALRGRRAPGAACALVLLCSELAVLPPSPAGRC